MHVKTVFRSDASFKYFSCTLISFNKNIELSKFIHLPIQMWDSSFFHALSWVFMKNIEVWKFTHFLVRIWDSSYFHTFWYNIKLSKFGDFPVRIWDSSYFHTLRWVFMKNIKLSEFTQFRYGIQGFSCAFIGFLWKYPTFKFREIPVFFNALL